MSLRIAKTARAELVARYRAKVIADAALSDYLLGILHQLGVDPEQYAGFDDATGEILLKPDGLEE